MAFSARTDHNLFGIAIYDQFFAGMADALTFGTSSQVRRLIHGQNATQNHSGVFFNLGRFGGAIASVWIGSYAASPSSIKTAPWWARAALGYDLLGTTIGFGQVGNNILNGNVSWWDILPLLPLLIWSGGKVRLTPKGLRFSHGGKNSPEFFAQGLRSTAFPDELKSPYNPSPNRPIIGQEFDFSCVAGTCRMLIGDFGIDMPAAYVRGILNTGESGTYLSDAPNALSQVGNYYRVPQTN